ncbi:MAG: glycosyltransferase [bacterium]|nr:glycosyltransferase [bacterium]
MSVFSIIIPTLNEEHYLRATLESLRKELLLISEVLVVDGKSHDKTLELARTFNFVSTVQTSPPVGNQRSTGGYLATGEWLLFLDADVQLPPGFLGQCLEYLDQHHLEIACPRYQPQATHWYIHLFYTIFNTLFWSVQRFFPSGAGSCIFVKKTVYQNNKTFSREILTDDYEYINRVGRVHRFGMLPFTVHVSDRRFKKDGFAKTVLTYLRLSWCFIRRQHPALHTFAYSFGDYNLPIRTKR